VVVEYKLPVEYTPEVPLQPGGEMEQLVAFVEDHCIQLLPPYEIEVGVAEMLAVGAGGCS